MQKQNIKYFIPTISILQAISYNENKEPLINLADVCPEILCDYRRKDSDINTILVKKTIADMLQRVQKQLTLHDLRMQLLVVEGYRSLACQERCFLKQMLVEHKKYPTMDFESLLEHVHQFIALPSVAGHPTGGAVDLTIACEGQEIDMGGEIADFSIPERLPTYSSLVTSEQAMRRLLLHDLMVAEGFAPFYGEWWHFSYGDREWTAFYDASEAFPTLQ